MDDLNPSVRQDIQNRISAANELTGDWQKDQEKGLFKEFKPVEYNIGGSMNDAIMNKAMAKFYDPALANIQTQQRAAYAGKTQAQLRNAQQMGLGQLRYDNARAIAAAQRTAQEEAQRAAFVGNLFQGAGIVAGIAAGNPAAGALVGGAIGKQVSQSSSAPAPSSGYMVNNRLAQV